MRKIIATVKVVFLMFTFCSAGESVLEKAHSKELTAFTFEDCKRFIGFEGFRSKEELLQLFYNAYFSGNVKNFRVNHWETEKIGKAITTLFPIKHCDSIVSFDTTLLLMFDKQQNVNVPGTYGQAHLEMSKHLGFTLEVDQNNYNVLRFKIVEGFVKLRISKLLQLFNSSMGNMDGSELYYFLNARQRVSVIGLNEYIDIARKSIFLKGDTSVIFIDLDNSKFKENEDIVIKKNEMRFFNISFSLKGTDSIRYNGNPWKKDSVSATQIRYTIDAIRKGFVTDALFPGGLRVNKSAICQLEEKRVQLSTGFNLIK
jgi:hypothetical protein